MAYSAVVTVVRGPRGLFEITIEETGASTSDEKEIPLVDYDLPIDFDWESGSTAKVSGTCATTNPQLAQVTGATLSTDIIAKNLVPAAQVSNIGLPPIPWRMASGSLFHRSGADAGSDNHLRTIYRIRARQ
jgi:hypothetical protein